VRIDSISVSKTTLAPGESYTLTVNYTVGPGTYYIKHNGWVLDQFTTGGASGTRKCTLTAPSSPGTYTYTVTLEQLYGEKDTKSYTISVISVLPEASFTVEAKLSIYHSTVTTWGGKITNTDSVTLNFNYEAELGNMSEGRLLDTFSGSTSIAPGSWETLVSIDPVRIGKEGVTVKCIFKATGSGPGRKSKRRSDSEYGTTF